MAVTLNASSTAGFVTTADTSTILQLQTNGTAALTVDASQNVGIGTASPGAKFSLTSTGSTTADGVRLTFGSEARAHNIYSALPTGRDLTIAPFRALTINTGSGTTEGVLGLNAYEYTTFGTGSSYTERMRINSSGNVGIGTSSPTSALEVSKASVIGKFKSTSDNSTYLQIEANNGSGSQFYVGQDSSSGGSFGKGAYAAVVWQVGAYPMIFATNNTERARIDSSGNLLVGTTTNSPAGNNVVGAELQALGSLQVSRDGGSALQVNRKTDDGELVAFRQAGTQEGSISVSGTTVSYNGGHLARWAQTTTAKDDTLVKGTVLSNLDEMNVYTDADGNPVDNEQLNKVKVSDVEGDANVAGVFVNWSHDDAHDVDEINMAMTGDMIIRIAQGTTVARGDLLMSAGDGTAKPQGDDIVRSKTVAKVTSTHVTCTHADGSYCVPCVLMAC